MLQRWAASARAPAAPSRPPGAAAPRPARRPRCTPTPPAAPAQALRAPVRPGHGLLGMQGAAEGARGDRGAGIPQRGRGARRGPGGEAAVVQGPSPATEARLARLTRRGSPGGRCTHRRSEPRGSMEGAVVPCLSSAGPLEPHMRSEADRLLPAGSCRSASRPFRPFGRRSAPPESGRTFMCLKTACRQAGNDGRWWWVLRPLLGSQCGIAGAGGTRMRIKTAHLLQRIPATAALTTNGNLLGQEARVGIAINSARRP
jgi:hypothetical protein